MKKINLSIPKPCHENWDAMTTVEKGKFCGACQKVVVDFTRMNDRELAAFFKKPLDNICGRFQQEQLNRDIVMPRKRVPWVKCFFQITLPAFLLSLKSSAQKSTKGEISVICQKEIQGKLVVPPTQSSMDGNPKDVKGKVVDEKGKAVPYATVVVKGTKTGAACDGEGNFALKLANKVNSLLIASAVGYSPKEITVRDSLPLIIAFDEPQPVALGGLVVCRVNKNAKPIPLIKQLVDTAFKKFSIYPNPVSQNSVVTINTKKMELGEYTFSLVSVTAAVIQTKEIKIESKQQLVSFSSGEVNSGNYYVTLTNKKSGKAYTEKLIVQ